MLHLLARGEKVKVFTSFPDVFDDLPIEIAALVAGDEFGGVRHFRHKLGAEGSEIGNFTGCCQSAGIAEPIELKIDWKVNNPALLNTICDAAKGRKSVV